MQGHLAGHAYHHHRQLEPTLLHAGVSVSTTTAGALSAGHGMSLGQGVVTSAGQVISSAGGSVFRLPEPAAPGTSNGVQSAAVIEQTQQAVQRLKLK